MNQLNTVTCKEGWGSGPPPVNLRESQQLHEFCLNYQFSTWLSMILSLSADHKSRLSNDRCRSECRSASQHPSGHWDKVFGGPREEGRPNWDPIPSKHPSRCWNRLGWNTEVIRTWTNDIPQTVDSMIDSEKNWESIDEAGKHSGKVKTFQKRYLSDVRWPQNE
jgi:hypothetical protein